MNISGRRFSQNDVVISEPFPRGGDGLFLRVQLIDAGGTTGNMTVEVFTRNTEDNWPAGPIGTGGSGASLGTLTVETTVGTIYELHVPPSSTAADGIKEQVRLKFTGPSSAGWSIIRVFPPLFYDAAIGTV